MSSVGSYESSEDDRSEDLEPLSQDLSSTSSLELEDIQEAINGVKRTIMETEVSSEARRELVHKLIRLRIKREYLEEKKLLQVVGEEEHQGHVMVPCENISASRGVLFCGECGGTLWYLVQTVYTCKVMISSQWGDSNCFVSQHCSLLVHSQCLTKIRRKCVGMFLASVDPEETQSPKYYDGSLLMSICPELSLVEQHFQCGDCPAELTQWGACRLCDYTGQLYCSQCHWGSSLLPSPARICHNWDFSLRPMSEASIQYLQLVIRRPLIDLVHINPSLTAVVQEVAAVLRQRHQLISMKKYLQVCRIAGEERLLTLLQDRQHFVDSPRMFSLQDMIDLNSGVLAQYLQSKLDVFKSHIITCLLCMAKSFVCELCSSKECLFPFDSGVEVCRECEAVFHRDCFRSVTSCPRCDRKREKKDVSSGCSVFTVDMD